MTSHKSVCNSAADLATLAAIILPEEGTRFAAPQITDALKKGTGRRRISWDRSDRGSDRGSEMCQKDSKGRASH